MRSPHSLIKQEPLLALPLLRHGEHERYNRRLQEMTLFPHANVSMSGGMYRIVLNFSFRGIDFSKKRVLPFFLALELLTNQKCVVTQSSRNVLSWKLRKGMMVGCKVTLRGNASHDFLDSLQLALPRMEKLQVVRLGRTLSNSLSMRLAELVLFYPIELGLGLHSDVQRVEVNFLFRSLAREEKLFLLTSSKIPVRT
jgi:large subunit ribosomal protein L5